MFSVISDVMEVFEIILPRVANDFSKRLPGFYHTSPNIHFRHFFLSNFEKNSQQIYSCRLRTDVFHTTSQLEKKVRFCLLILLGNNKEIDQNRFAQIVFIAIYSARSVINGRINFI